MQSLEDFEQVLEQLVQGSPPDTTLYRLSNLHGKELARLAQAWPMVPNEHRSAIASRLVQIGEDDFEVDFGEVFKIGLQDMDARVRVSAIEGLWEVEDIALIRPIIRMLEQDPSVLVREAAATSLSRFALLAELGRLQPRQVDWVWNALWTVVRSPTEDMSVRRRTIESIAYFERPEITQLIQETYQDEEPKMRVSAVFAMGRSGDPEWADKVLEELYTDDPEMRYEATRACGELKLIEATSALSRLVADADPEIKLAAVWSLGQIGTPEARRVLEICYEQGDEALEDAAEKALAEVDFMDGDIEFPAFDLSDDEGTLD
jgi:HEAT repeat protein